MANVKLSAIAGAGAIVGADTIVGVQSGTTDVQYTYTNAAAFYAAATNTLTNKTFDTAGTGNVFKINGTGITAVTGTGSVVLATSPTLVTPNIGVATATSVNGNIFTTGTYTLTGAAGKTLTFSNTLTFAGTDSSTLNIGTGGTLGTAAFVNTGTSGATIPLLNAANTFSAAQVISTNAGTPPAPSTNTKLQIAGTDSNSCILEIDAYGAGGTNTPNVIQRRFSGTAASPTATQAGGILGQNIFGGYDGSALQSGALIKATTINLWSGSDRSAFIDFQVTASGSTSITNQMRLQGSGGLSVGNANVATDDGAGGIRATKYNLVTITAPATGSTLTIADGKTATVNNTLTLAGTDATTMTFPTTSATIARTDAGQTFAGNNTFSSSLTVPSIFLGAANTVTWTGRGVLSSTGVGNLQHGAADAAAPVAQTISFQSVVAGNANTAGANATVQGSLSNGSGAGGDILIKTTLSVAASGTQNTAATALTIKGGTQNVVAAAALTSASASGGIGYSTGAGGAVTQATNKSTGVTLNTTSGQITMNNATLAGQTEVSFTLTNSAIAATDVVLVTIASGATANSYVVGVAATAAGSCVIQLGNVTLATTLGEAIVLNFVVIKGVTS